MPDEPQLGLVALDVATRAAMAVARLDQAMAQLPNPGLLLRPIIRREAVSTSALEGTYAAFYIDGLLEVSKTGDFDPRVEFFSTAVLEQAHEGVRVIADLLGFRDRTIAKLRHDGGRGSALQTGENLIGYPILDVPTARDLTGKTFHAANQAIGNLVSQGVLREVTGRPTNRLAPASGYSPS